MTAAGWNEDFPVPLPTWLLGSSPTQAEPRLACESGNEGRRPLPRPASPGAWPGGQREGLASGEQLVEFIPNEGLWLTPGRVFSHLKNDLSSKQTKPIECNLSTFSKHLGEVLVLCRCVSSRRCGSELLAGLELHAHPSGTCRQWLLSGPC